MAIFSMSSFDGGQTSYSADMQADEARRQAARKGRGEANVRLQLRMLEANLAKAMLINEALWELIRDQHRLTDDDLNQKLYDIDMRDGQLDGKNQRSEVTECPNCRRKVSPRHPACIYCGQVIDQSVFSIT